MKTQATHREWPVLTVWALLAGATLSGFLMVEELATGRIAVSAALLLAAFKINLVFGQYMEVRWAHRPLRQLLSLWLLVVTTILLFTYWLA